LAKATITSRSGESFWKAPRKPRKFADKATNEIAEKNDMKDRPENEKNVLTAFTCLTAIAILAWILGCPILAVILDLGAMAALVVTVCGHRFSHSGINTSNPQP
jgi:fatty acid desaturase